MYLIAAERSTTTLRDRVNRYRRCLYNDRALCSRPSFYWYWQRAMDRSY